MASIVAAGHTVLVETGAGVGSGSPDEKYAAVGAKICDTAKELWDTCDFLAKVKEIDPSEFGYLKEGQMIYCCIHLAGHPEEVQASRARCSVLDSMLTINGGKGKFVSGFAGAPGMNVLILGGGSSINLLLLRDGVNGMPPRINHLRIGGSIANPRNIRMNRGIAFDGMREDTMFLTAEIVEVHEKDSLPKGMSTKNWAGESVARVDKGRRIQAILALGSQDVGDASSLLPVDCGIEVVGCSSDHTIVDVADSAKQWRSGDPLTFKVRYANMLYAFTGQHVRINYRYDPQTELC